MKMETELGNQRFESFKDAWLINVLTLTWYYQSLIYSMTVSWTESDMAIKITLSLSTDHTLTFRSLFCHYFANY